MYNKKNTCRNFDKSDKINLTLIIKTSECNNKFTTKVIWKVSQESYYPRGTNDSTETITQSDDKPLKYNRNANIELQLKKKIFLMQLPPRFDVDTYK